MGKQPNWPTFYLSKLNKLLSRLYFWMSVDILSHALLLFEMLIVYYF